MATPRQGHDERNRLFPLGTQRPTLEITGIVSAAYAVDLVRHQAWPRTGCGV